MSSVTISFREDGTMDVQHSETETSAATYDPLAHLMRAMRERRCHVMMTPPRGRYGWEVSLSPEVEDEGRNDMFHGEHPTDPMAALLLALEKYHAAYPPAPDTGREP